MYKLSFNLLPSSSPSSSPQTMETLQDGEELVFLYQLVPGHSDTSYACHIASTAGLSKEIVQRAAQVRDIIGYSG